MKQDSTNFSEPPACHNLDQKNTKPDAGNIGPLTEKVPSKQLTFQKEDAPKQRRKSFYY